MAALERIVVDIEKGPGFRKLIWEYRLLVVVNLAAGFVGGMLGNLLLR